jgi:hypothetical protein
MMPSDHPFVENESASIRVIEAIAAHEGTDPFDLEPPLYHAVDPDALDDLFDRDRPASGVTVQFVYDDLRVTINSHRDVRVRPLDRAANSDPPSGDAP